LLNIDLQKSDIESNYTIIISSIYYKIYTNICKKYIIFSEYPTIFQNSIIYIIYFGKNLFGNNKIPADIYSVLISNINKIYI